MLDVRAARPEEFETVMNFYYDLTDRMMGSAYEPGWEKDVYPTRGFVRQSIENGELYVGYPSMGFQYITTLKLFYEDTGLTDFLLYELPLSDV